MKELLFFEHHVASHNGQGSGNLKNPDHFGVTPPPYQLIQSNSIFYLMIILKLNLKPFK